MKILIAYASVTGTAKDCAHRLAKELSRLDVDVVDLAAANPDPSEYDLVLLGGCVRFGKLCTPLRRFLKEKETALLSRFLGLFLVCGLAHEYEYYCETLLPTNLREHAFTTLYFGGDLRPKNAGLLDRLFLSSMRAALRRSELEDAEYTPTLPGLLPDAVEKMAVLVRQAIEAEK